MKSNAALKWLLFLSLCVIWGSSFKLMGESAKVINPQRLAALRIFSAAVVLLPFALLHIQSIPRRKLGIVALNGTIGNLLPAFLFAYALNDPALTGPMGGILNAFTPICLVLISVIFYHDKISLHKLLGIGVGFIGLILLKLIPVFNGEETLSLAGLIPTALILLATMLYGINVNLVAHKLQGIDPIKLATVSLGFMIIPTTLCLIFFDFGGLHFQDPTVQMAIWKGSLLGIMGSAVATLIFYSLLKQAGGLFASLVTYGIPVVALIIGWFDHIEIHPLQVLCLGIILSGVYLVNKKD